ncbi:hypothetical protein [Streptomyces viridochromogenes]|nr:hypothetical protein [Streptomyces viridochromogenes]
MKMQSGAIHKAESLAQREERACLLRAEAYLTLITSSWRTIRPQVPIKP